MRKETKIVLCIVISILIFSSATLISIGLYGKNDNATFDEDVVIVLGCAVKGTKVSNHLANRLDAAFEYHTKNPNALIVVSGGQGPNEDITEALAMETYLVNKGTPIGKIIKEEASTSTYENLLYSQNILKNIFNDSYKAAIITNDFHIYRSQLIAKKLGFSATHYHADTEPIYMPYNYSREALSIIKFFITGK
ncbi:MAG: YdcF family protein [Clostridiales bacterium]|nr:YdcF family protein [Clostridiales bacterium]